MNKIVYCLLTLSMLFVIGACAQFGAHGPGALSHSPVATDPFRIVLKSPYGATYPVAPTPPPNPSGQVYWYDVWDWQDFLYKHGFAGSLQGTYPVGNPGNFDMNTVNATKAFQGSQLGGAPVAVDGKVGISTYNKARNAGMPAYPTFTMP